MYVKKIYKKTNKKLCFIRRPENAVRVFCTFKFQL